MDVRVSFDERASGWLRVSATFHDVDPRGLKFRPMGGSEFVYEDVRFTGPTGALNVAYEEPHWVVEDAPPGAIQVDWRVKPGGMGRHGHQGWVEEGWASFDGRILFMPQSRRSVRKARIRFDLPEGWTAIHPFVDVGGDLVLEDAVNFRSVMAATCVAMGPYTVREQSIGESTVRVGVPSAWDAEHTATLFTKTFASFQWFHDTLGFDRRAPFAIAWTPAVGQNEKVFGGASVNGACYEHPEENARNWLLLGHRIGHPMNKYAPAGMTLRDDRDHWFMEGWASYVEVVAAEESGALPDQRHWNTIWRRHLRERNRHPEWDVPLAEEPKHPEAAEYLHYTKGPLVVKHLDNLMRTRSGTDLERFMKAMWAKYGFQKAAFPLREEIEAFTGDSYDDFWATFVDRRGEPFPTWPELVDPNIERRMSDAAIAVVGDTAIHPEYLFFLAWSGHFERYADIVDFVERSTHRQAILESRGVRWMPEAVSAVQYALPAHAQYAIARTALDWNLDDLPRGAGCMGSTPDPGRASLVVSDNPEGATFSRLLELEREYESALGTTIHAVNVRAPKTVSRKRPRLGVSPGEPFVFHTGWLATPPRAGFELHADGKKVKAKQLTIDPTWRNTHMGFAPGDRPADASILTLKAGPDPNPVVSFSIWQRAAPFAARQEPR